MSTHSCFFATNLDINTISHKQRFKYYLQIQMFRLLSLCVHVCSCCSDSTGEPSANCCSFCIIAAFAWHLICWCTRHEHISESTVKVMPNFLIVFRALVKMLWGNSVCNRREITCASLCFHGSGYIILIKHFPESWREKRRPAHLFESSSRRAQQT